MPDPTAPDIPGWLAICAAVAAIAGAAYSATSARAARRQADAAEQSLRETRAQSALTKAELQEMRRQSDISLHSHRLEIYKAFVDFRFDLKAHGAGFQREKLWAFWTHARLSEFYFSAPIATALSSTVDKALKIQMLNERVKDPQGAELAEVRKLRDESVRLYWELDDALDVLDAEVKAALQLVAN